MGKIKIKIDNFGSMVVFKVLEQCESIRCPLDNGIRRLEYIASNGVVIESRIYQGIGLYNGGYVNILGQGFLVDNSISSITLDDEREAKEWIGKFIDALQEWSNNGYFFRGNYIHDSYITKKEDDGDCVYVF